ncbi:MAG: hypothetical protein AAF802_19775 [Planctomycetota bacterium]
MENLLAQFPSLGNDDDILDLIDAEICVRRELGESQPAEFFSDRFPSLSEEIAQLVFLDAAAGLPENQQRLDQVSISGDALIEEASAKGLTDQGVTNESDWTFDSDKTIAGGAVVSDPVIDPGKDSIDAPIPIQPPEWMTSARCVATEISELGRVWLVQGQDVQRDESVAMKIIPIPASLGKLERTRMLDLCELASNVVHPAWVTPRIAAINNGHLAVIRPWVFRAATGHAKDEATSAERGLVQLVAIAFASAAAHRVGATHGGISSRNLFVDHHQKPHLVDCVASSAGWARYLAIWSNDLSKTLCERRRADVDALKRLVAGVCVDATMSGDESIWSEWFAHSVASIDSRDDHAAAAIGEVLQTAIDRGPQAKRRWWSR